MTTTPTRRFKGQTADERRAQRRSQLEQAALDIIGERGWHEATMTEICRAAGLTERYFYESFGNREDLYLALIERLGEQMLVEVLEAISTAGPDSQDRVRAAAGTVVTFLVGDPRRGRAALMEGVGSGELERKRREIVLGLTDAMADNWQLVFGDGERPQEERTLITTAIAGTIAALIVRRLDGALDTDDVTLTRFIADAVVRIAEAQL